MVLPDPKAPPIALLGQSTVHSFFPAKSRIAVARGGDPGRRSFGQRLSALSLVAASTMATLRSQWVMLLIVLIVASSMQMCGAAHAEPTSSDTDRGGSQPVDPFANFVVEASKRFAVPECWIRAVMHVESAGKSRARSPKGAIGLMQIMPETWAELRARYGFGADAYDPHDNILAGAAYMRELHDRYGSPGFLAAYNAGPRRYERFLVAGHPLPGETLAYVATLAPIIGGKQLGSKIGTLPRSFALAGSPLFVVRSTNAAVIDPSPRGLQPNGPLNERAVVDLSALVPQSGRLFVRQSTRAQSQ
jgi:Transglycosylase SLT domain